MLTGRKLPLSLAFAVLAGLAFGAGCNGFFTDPVLQSIAIDPTSPQVDAGKTINLRVFGTYDNGDRKVVTSGVSWTSVASTVATIDANGVLKGVSPGSSDIKASAQALEASATASVILTGVGNISVTPDSDTTSNGGSAATFTFTATSGTTAVDITTDNGGILTISPSTTHVTCTASGNLESCSTDGSATPQDYFIKMTYPGTSKFATAQLTVTS